MNVTPSIRTGLVVSSRSHFSSWELLPRPHWTPTLSAAAPEQFRFVDATTDIAVSIMVIQVGGSGMVAHGFLIPAAGPCPLCADLRQVTVRVNSSAAFSTRTHTPLTKRPATEPTSHPGLVEMARPCPACRIPDFLLAAFEHMSEGDLR